ncbi:filamin ABP280 repeat-containing, putative [Babesia ovis]|uniref:Filamin ABP280 repeat-containing, putative n=1 Tax=Babesia ovis TaxID=5869 RepID=A0A9W5TDT1_BABOV|nr:filamin ABP280 repeat-containing, putative [Babesia ovis]
MIDYDIERGSTVEPLVYNRYIDTSDVCPALCRHRGSAFRGGLVGRCLEGILELYDRNGRHVVGRELALTAVLSYKANAFNPREQTLDREVYITPIDSCRYKLRYMVEIAGSWTLSVILPSGEHVAGSPFNIEIEPAEASPYTTMLICMPQNGYESDQKEFIIEAMDGFGNKLRKGGTPFVVTCIGTGKLLSLFDCNNGQHRVVCQTEPNSMFSQLRVTLMGKDIVNSPFVLSLPTPAPSSTSDSDPFAVTLNRCKQVYAKQRVLHKAYEDLSASLVKEQREASKSYHSTRLQIVHTLPVKFNIADPDTTLAAKRQDMIARHNQLSADIEELSAKIRATEAVGKEILDDLVNRFETSSRLHKDAVAAYKVVRQEIENRVQATKASNRLDTDLRRGDPDAIRKYKEQQSLNETFPAYYKGSDKPGNATKRVQLITRQYMSNEAPSGVTSTTPDRPNTPAFWMMEGRFKPPRPS